MLGKALERTPSQCVAEKASVICLELHGHPIDRAAARRVLDDNAGDIDAALDTLRRDLMRVEVGG